MSKAAISIFAFGLYLAMGGLLLVLVPEESCRLLHLRPPGETMWVRLSGMFFLDLAFYCIQAALHEQRSFIRWSIKTRPLTIVFLGAFVALGLENPSILLFGVVDLLATVWTALALRTAGGDVLPANGLAGAYSETEKDAPRRIPPRRGERALQARSASEGYVDSCSAVANALAK